jgi:hypothetical protein
LRPGRKGDGSNRTILAFIIVIDIQGDASSWLARRTAFVAIEKIATLKLKGTRFHHSHLLTAVLFEFTALVPVFLRHARVSWLSALALCAKILVAMGGGKDG